MLIIPFASKMTFKPVPWVTAGLVLINCFILVFIQSSDNEAYVKATRYYSQSILPALEVPVFVSFLVEEGRADEANEIREVSPQKIANGGFSIMLQHEAKFIQQLHQHKWITPEHTRFEQWAVQREEFEKKLSGIVSEEYAFQPDRPEAVDMFTHMFLHGGFDHLLGNMVFLILLGFVVERLIGSLLYGAVYILGGLCAVTSFALVSAGHGVSLVGASGAIGALMGIYVVLFGWRKIPFFYSLGFYFDFVKAPALLLLVAFLVKELYFHFTSDNNVAYMAHFGGILSGALCGFLLTRLMTIPVDEMLAELEKDEQTHVKPWQTEFDMAMSHIEKLQFEKAGAIFARLHDTYPDEGELLKEWYKVERNLPSGQNFHASARKMMMLKANNRTMAQQIRTVYDEYLKLAKPKPIIDRTLIVSLAYMFAEHGFLTDAEKLVRLLVKKSPAAADLLPLVLLLARKLRYAKQEEQAIPYLKWVVKHANESTISKQAQALLEA